MYPKLAGAQSLARIAEETLPKMLAPGESEWKAAAARLAERVKGGDGLDTAASLVAIYRSTSCRDEARTRLASVTNPTLRGTLLEGK